MAELVNLPVEIILTILACLPARSLLELSSTCRSFNYLSTSTLLERHGIRDPANCTFDLHLGGSLKADALSALQEGIHIQRMKYLRCDVKTSFHYSTMSGWPAAKPLRRLHRLILRLSSIDEVVLSFTGRSFFLDDGPLKLGVGILQNLLNTIITKSCKTLRIINSGCFFGGNYTFISTDNASSIAKGFHRFVNRNNSPDGKYKRQANGARVFLTCSPLALQQVVLTKMEIDAMSLFTPPCSNWTFTMLKESRITSLTLNLTWPMSGYKQAERALIFSRLADALHASLKSLFLKGVTFLLEALDWMAQLPLLDSFGVLPLTWKASSSENSSITSFPLVLSIGTITAPADLVFYMFSRPLTLPKLRKILLDFEIGKEGLFDITTTAASFARLRGSIGPNVGVNVLLYLHGTPPLEESLCSGVQPTCPVWEKEFSRFTVLYLNFLTALLDSTNSFRVILGVLTLFPELKELHIRLQPSSKVDPSAASTPIDLKTWMVDAILDRSPKITYISAAGRMIPRKGAWEWRVPTVSRQSRAELVLGILS